MYRSRNAVLRVGAILVAALLPLAAGAQRAPVPVFELTDADLARIDIHDGSSADWLTVVGEPSLTLGDFDLHPYEDPPSGIDLRAWLAWHADPVRLYVALEIVDDEYLPDHFLPTDGAGDGRLDIALDGDHSGGDLELNSIGSQDVSTAQVYFIYAAGAAGRGDRRLLSFQEWLSGGSSWHTAPPHADVGVAVFSEAPTVTLIELFLTPFDRLLPGDEERSVASTWQAGATIGLSLAYIDRDTRSQTGFRLGGLTTADDLATAVLLSATAVGEPDAPALVSQAWARIKVALRAAAKARP